MKRKVVVLLAVAVLLTSVGVLVFHFSVLRGYYLVRCLGGASGSNSRLFGIKSDLVALGADAVPALEYALESRFGADGTMRESVEKHFDAIEGESSAHMIFLAAQEVGDSRLTKTLIRLLPLPGTMEFAAATIGDIGDKRAIRALIETLRYWEKTERYVTPTSVHDRPLTPEWALRHLTNTEQYRSYDEWLEWWEEQQTKFPQQLPWRQAFEQVPPCYYEHGERYSWTVE